MRLLGVSCGEREGSVELLLRSALCAAREPSGKVDVDVDVDVGLVRLGELRIPFGEALGHEPPPPDDAPWFWEQLMECDGLVLAAPIYGRSVPGALRLLADRLLGPNADAAFVQELVALRRAGREPSVPFRVDERVLKPRVAGFIACGGSLAPQWKTLALPLMHAFTFSMQVAVIDQVQFAGAGTPASIVLDPAALARAQMLGQAVASQLGRPFSEARYLGEPGLCPMCHLSVISVSGEDVECATCGAKGHLAVRDGTVAVDFDAAGRTQSVISMDEKRAHFFEVQETAARHAQRAAEIRSRAASLLADTDVPVLTPDPSIASAR